MTAGSAGIVAAGGVTVPPPTMYLDQRPTRIYCRSFAETPDGGELHRGERAESAAQTVAQVLHDFLHTDTSALSHKTIYLVTIEGERIDIEPMSVEEIKGIIMAAKEGEY